MVFTCKICKNRSNLGLFGPPSKPSALNNWRIAAKIPVETKTSNFKLCFRHFDSQNIEAVIKIEYSLKNKGKKSVIHKVSQPDSQIGFRQTFEVKCIFVSVDFLRPILTYLMPIMDVNTNFKLQKFWRAGSHLVLSIRSDKK